MTRRKQSEDVEKLDAHEWLVCFRPSGGCYRLRVKPDGNWGLFTGAHARPAGDSAVARFMERALAAVLRHEGLNPDNLRGER